MNQKLASLIQEQQNAFYLFDTIKLKKRIKYLQARLPEEISLCYAVKANPFITKEIGDELERFEICSPGEAE
ncbi:MAG: diaminopimelate decarboxylase, partial [Clostridiales bacterium]|nr:diaminopimelate decarboxylase [Clostridiales bacterium]